ncbi:hypothetical protein VARIO8X_60320 [Burkholderiales bacterium 8X]|nr:hypothetical protein VARIO8X_60320 [Burkholderiales bacterium 8X]
MGGGMADFLTPADGLASGEK